MQPSRTTLGEPQDLSPLTTERSIRTSATRSVAALEGLKAYDDWGWLDELEQGARVDWLRRLHWIEMVDRLAVEEPLPEDAESYANHFILPCDPLELGAIWRAAWRRYIQAAHRYRHQTSIAKLTTHREMLVELSGNQFCLFSEVDLCTRRSIVHFGALDRFFTNLRDLSQDLRRGVQSFPAELLKRFGLRALDLVSHGLRSKPGYLALMRFWLDEYLPSLQVQAADFSQNEQLPTGLRLLRDACLRRHARIESAFRECSLDLKRADAVYWREVERFCPIAATHVGSSSPSDSNSELAGQWPVNCCP
jgi:15-cis-phytoene synthase